MKDDQFFAGLIGQLEERRYSEHPSAWVIRRYVQRRLPEGRDFVAEVQHLLTQSVGRQWTLSEVSLHVATCTECAHEVAQLRAAGGLTTESHIEKHQSGILSRKMRQRLAYSIPVAVTLAVIIVLFFLPHPIATSYCRFGGLAM